MADVAVIFGWSPPVMNDMDLSELMGWRTRAAKRANPQT
jgi:hypothetical protein